VATDIRLDTRVLQALCCPVCRAKLALDNERFKCLDSQCQSSFPIVDGVPILINESSSVFSIDDLVRDRSPYLPPRSARVRAEKLKLLGNRIVPQISRNIRAKQNYRKFGQLLIEHNESPLVLIVGGRVVGPGLESLLSLLSIQFVETDVSFGPRTALICDAHDIPFDDGTFDGAIAQGVLEHVVDPYRCAEEIHRVLKDRGLVYAETPFMQQVHASGRCDFTRFTHLGQRRLFRRFDEICSGAVCGPGMALAWSYQHFLLSFVETWLARMLAKTFARLTSFWLTYLDYILIDKPGTFDAASAHYFMGRKSSRVLTDRELVELYRGGIR